MRKFIITEEQLSHVKNGSISDDGVVLLHNKSGDMFVTFLEEYEPKPQQSMSKSVKEKFSEQNEKIMGLAKIIFAGPEVYPPMKKAREDFLDSLSKEEREKLK